MTDHPITRFSRAYLAGHFVDYVLDASERINPRYQKYVVTIRAVLLPISLYYSITYPHNDMFLYTNIAYTFRSTVEFITLGWNTISNYMNVNVQNPIEYD